MEDLKAYNYYKDLDIHNVLMEGEKEDEGREGEEEEERGKEVYNTERGVEKGGEEGGKEEESEEVHKREGGKEKEGEKEELRMHPTIRTSDMEYKEDILHTYINREISTDEDCFLFTPQSYTHKILSLSYIYLMYSM